MKGSSKFLTDYLRWVFQSPLRLFVALLVVVFLVYRRSLQHPFMLEDEMILGYWFRPLNLDSILACFDPHAREIIYFRPIVSVFNLLLYHLTGGSAVLYRVISLVLFAGFLTLVYTLTLRLFRQKWVAAGTVFLYAVHPINSLYINPLSCSAILIWGIFCVIALLMHIQFLDGKKPAMKFGLLFMALAMATHEMAATLPGFMCLVSLYLKRNWNEAIRHAAIFGSFVAALLLARFLIVPASGGMYSMIKAGTSVLGLDFWNYTATTGVLLAWYLKQLIWPTQLLLIKTIPLVKSHVGLINMCVGGSLLALTAIVFAVKNRTAVFLIAWLIIGLSPFLAASLIYPFEGLTIEPNWFMMGALAFFWAAALLGRYWLQGFDRTIVFSVVLGALVTSGVYTQKYNEIWSSQRSYCQYWLSLQPSQQIANFWLAIDYLGTQEYAPAKEHFKRALNGSYLDWEVFVNLGVIALQEDQLIEAIEWSQKALRVNPRSAEAFCNLGAAAWRQGRPTEAKDLFERALAADPAFTKAREYLELVAHLGQSQ